MPNFPLLTFASGELSPQIDARSDVDKYRAGCRILENMIPRIYGPATRRPGTKYIDTCNGVARVMPFIYSNTIAYILLFEDHRIWFYYDGGRVLDSSGRRLYVDSPYLEADLFELQFKQSNDVMWIVHPDYLPRKLTRTSASSFSLDTITFNNGPFKKRNDLAEDDDVTLTPSVTTGTGTLTASSAMFDSAHVGALFSITQPRVNVTVSGSRTTADGAGVIGGGSILTEGPCTLNLSDGWAGTVELQRSIDDGATWEVRRSFYSNDGKRAVQYSFDEQEDDILHRIYVSSISDYTEQISIYDEDGYAGERTVTKDGEVSGDLTVNSSTQTGRCRVTGFVSTTIVNMTVLKDFASTNADTRWAEGCWSGYRGYPSSVTFFEERCVYAGTPHQPQTVWLSATDDYENFDAGTNDDDSFSLTLSSETRNAIQWIASLEALLLGTSGGEWRIGTSAEGEALTPKNYTVKQQTNYGSRSLQALQVGDVILFADFVGRRVRELTYSGSKYKYIANDLTALAEHITESGVIDMAFQRNPDPILWCFLTDGTLISMTYEREQNVIGWARHPFNRGSDAESVFETESTGYLSVPQYSYPTLQELTAAEIPDAPIDPDGTPLSGETNVSNATGLQAMSGSGHYSITADIDLNGVTWSPIANFSGVIEGNGYTISNLSITGSSSNQGLFSSLSTGAEINNLNFSNCSVTGVDYIGILVGRVNAQTDIILRNITFTSCTVTGNRYVGCFAGEMNETYDCNIYYCDVISSTVNITANGSCGGGLVGRYNADETKAEYDYIVECSVQGGTINVTEGNGYCGGFIGQAVSGYTLTRRGGEIYDSYSTAAIEIEGDVIEIGGFAGNLIGWNCISCYASGEISQTFTSYQTGGGNIGGFIGDSSCFHDFINCYATGGITIDCSAQLDGFVNYTGNVGGFIGLLDSEDTHILRCYSTGSIAVTGELRTWTGFGGFVGRLRMGNYAAVNPDEPLLLERSWSEGDITFEISTRFSTTTKGGVGGFIGCIFCNNTPDAAATIQNCYAWGSIVFSDNPTDAAVGGFIGTNYATQALTVTVDNCYCAQTNVATGSGLTGQLPAGPFSNGFYGWESVVTDPTVTDSFYDTQTSTMAESGYGTAHVTSWMLLKSNYEDAGWDFDTIWYGLDDVIEDYSTSGLGLRYGLGVNAVAVIPSSTEDEIWVVVARYINGSVVRYLEQMQPRSWGSDDEDQWFVDSGLDYDSTATATFSGLDHLEGETLTILADGAVAASKTVSGGSITLDNPASRVIAGLPFRYTLKPMRMDLTSPSDTSQTAIKRIGEVYVSFYESGMAEYGVDVDHLFKLKWRTTEAYGAEPALFTGTKLLNPEGGFDPEDSFIITGNAPLNCTVRAIIPRMEVTGR